MAVLDNLPTVYEPKAVEPRVRAFWVEGHYFHADPADPRETYTIVIPPPNVTGALHGGHALNNTLQDILIRWRRMQGFNTLWMPGTDHAGIATQAVVERTILEKEKKNRHDLGREELVRRIWEWKETYGNRIIEQLKLMGSSCDWERTRFTLDDMCARAVRHTFFKLFRDGLIIRGKRLVNWDTQLQTAVADDEVYHETVKGHFYHFKYEVIDRKLDEPKFVHIATTRPETMLGDTAVAVHPDPEGYFAKLEEDLRKQLPRPIHRELDLPPAGETLRETREIEERLTALEERRRTHLPLLKTLRDMARRKRQVRLPLMDRPIPLICDEWADPMLGSGCVKITPAHDPNDYQVGERHKLPMVNVLTSDGRVARIIEPDGSVNPHSAKYEGLKFATEGRKKVVAELEALGLVEKIEDRVIDVGHSDRSKTPIEPYLSDQWFVRMGDLDSEDVEKIASPHMRQYAKEPRASARADQQPRGTVLPQTDAAQAKACGSLSPGLAQLAMDYVCEQPHANEEERKACGKVHFFPSRYAKTYLDWLGEKRDWCISRQLWWGHRIPVWRKEATAASTEPLIAELLVNEYKEIASFQCYDLVTLKPIPWVVALGDNTIHQQLICLREDNTELIQKLENDKFQKDPDVLDTWFSSALWPHSTLGWPEDTAELKRYYPGSVLSTAREIITLWVARMVITGLYNLGKVPFHDVYIHAVIQDALGRPFKKTLGNGFDPVDIIEFYGADALRYTMATLSTDTQDIRLPMKTVTVDGRELQSSERFELGRNFCNKIWNAARFAFMNLVGTVDAQAPPNPPLVRGGEDGPPLGRRGEAGELHKQQNAARAEARGSLDSLPIEDRWILSRVSAAAIDVQDALGRFQFSRAANAARDFFWDSLCDWYLELVKVRIRENRQVVEVRGVLAFALDQAIRLLHPFVPHITEQLWLHLNEIVPQRGIPGVVELDTGPALIVASYPPVDGWGGLANPQAESVFGDLQNATRAVRDIRQTQNVPPKQTVDVTIKVPADRVESLQREAHVIEELANVGQLTIDPNATASKNAATLMIGDMQVFVHNVIDAVAERTRLEKELANLDKQIAGISGKLQNEGFVSRAPAEVVEQEKQRLSDYQAKRDAVAASITHLQTMSD